MRLNKSRQLSALAPAGLGVVGAVVVCVIMGLSVALPPGVIEGFSSTHVGNATFVELQNKEVIDDQWVPVIDGEWGWISFGTEMNYFHAHITVFNLEPDSWYMVTLWSGDVGTLELLGSVGFFGLEEKIFAAEGYADVAFFRTDSYGWARQDLPDTNEEGVPVSATSSELLSAVDLPLGDYVGVCVHVKYVGTGTINWNLVISGGYTDLDDKLEHNIYEVEKLAFDLEGCPSAI